MTIFNNNFTIFHKWYHSILKYTELLILLTWHNTDSKVSNVEDYECQQYDAAHSHSAGRIAGLYNLVFEVALRTSLAIIQCQRDSRP